jgi:hypothetical protein
MPFPRKRAKTAPKMTLEDDMHPEVLDKFKDKSFEEVLATMANENKASMAASIITQIQQTGDPTAFKILQGVLERQGYSLNNELPISDERFKNLVKVFAGRI